MELLSSLGQAFPFSTEGVVVVAFVTALWYFWASKNAQQEKLFKEKGVPSVPSVPIFGAVSWMTKNWERFPDECLERFKEFGFKTFMGKCPSSVAPGKTLIFTANPECIQHVLKGNFDNYEKGAKSQSIYRELLGKGIFAVDGAAWKAHRKTASHMFSRNLIRSTTEVTLKNLYVMEEILKKKGGKGIDLQALFFRMTFDTTCYVTFGCDMGSLNVDSDQQHPFASAFDELQGLVLNRWTDPFFEIKRFLGISKNERRIVELKRALMDHSARLVRDRRRSIEQTKSFGPDMANRYLEAAKDTTAKSEVEEEIHWVVMNMLIAGRDTTAAGLGWTFYELMKRPEIVENIVNEVQDVCLKGKEWDYSHDTIQKLKYTHAVILEALRLHPSVPSDSKMSVNDDVFPDGTPIPGGSVITWSVKSTCVNPNVWGPTANEFDPDRFLNRTEPSTFEYPVFNAGPRICLGKTLALTTMKLTLAFLLPRFDFEDVKKHSGACRWALVESMLGGYELTVTEKK